MGNRSKPDRLWGALLSLPPPVIHHISSWYWEILVPHWQQEQTKEGCSWHQTESLSRLVLYLLNTLNAQKLRRVSGKASEKSRQTNATKPCSWRWLSRMGETQWTHLLEGWKVNKKVQLNKKLSSRPWGAWTKYTLFTILINIPVDRLLLCKGGLRTSTAH